MAIKASASEFLPDAISPQNELHRHNEALRDHLAGILAIKEALANDDLDEAAMLWCETPDQIKDALWVAPSKGGIFTSEERKAIQSDAMGQAMAEYQKRESK